MSLFGPRMKKVQEAQLNKEQLKDLTTQITSEINEKSKKQIDDLLNSKLITFKEEHEKLNSLLKTEIDKTTAGFYFRCNEYENDFAALTAEFNKVKNKRIITIFAESKGPLKKNEMFSFGNGGKVNEVGYTMMYNGRILKIGVSTTPLVVSLGHTIVYITVNDKPNETNKLQLFENTGDHSFEKTFNIPREVKRGDIIGFKSGADNDKAKNTVVCAIIEIDLDT